MDVYISEEYVNRKHEMRRARKQLHLQTDLKPCSSTKEGMSPRTPGDNSKAFPPSSPATAAAATAATATGIKTLVAVSAPSLDSIFDCFTP